MEKSIGFKCKKDGLKNKKLPYIPKKRNARLIFVEKTGMLFVFSTDSSTVFSTLFNRIRLLIIIFYALFCYGKNIIIVAVCPFDKRFFLPTRHFRHFIPEPAGKVFLCRTFTVLLIQRREHRARSAAHCAAKKKHFINSNMVGHKMGYGNNMVSIGHRTENNHAEIATQYA